VRPLPAPDVQRPVMHHRWRDAGFLHWRYPAAQVQDLLPAGVEVETFDGSAWLGIVPLVMDDVRAPYVPALPWLSRFPETNVRTYVRGPDGASAIWFFSLDAARLPVVVAARVGYGLPYFWSDMTVRRRGARLDSRSRRRFPVLREPMRIWILKWETRSTRPSLTSSRPSSRRGIGSTPSFSAGSPARTPSIRRGHCTTHSPFGR